MIIYASFKSKKHAGHTLGGCASCGQTQPLRAYHLRTYQWVLIVPIVTNTPVVFATCDVCAAEIEFPHPIQSVVGWSPDQGVPALAQSLGVPADHLPPSPITPQSIEATIRNASAKQPSIPASVGLWALVAAVVTAFVVNRLVASGMDVLGLDLFGATFLVAIGSFFIFLLIFVIIWAVRNAMGKVRQRVEETIRKYPQDKELWLEVAGNHPKLRTTLNQIVRGGG